MEQLWQMISMENDYLTKAMHKSFTQDPLHLLYEDAAFFPAETVPDTLFSIPETAPVPTPTVSGGSENDTPHAPKPRRSVTTSGRVTKRKSRVSKRAATTFIAADASNFRQMVQQVTGGSFGCFNGLLPFSPAMKEEAYGHCAAELAWQGGCLPSVESSVVCPDRYGTPGMTSEFSPLSAAADRGTAADGLDVESFCGFPTLESWKVML